MESGRARAFLLCPIASVAAGKNDSSPFSQTYDKIGLNEFQWSYVVFPVTQRIVLLFRLNRFRIIFFVGKRPNIFLKCLFIFLQTNKISFWTLVVFSEFSRRISIWEWHVELPIWNFQCGILIWDFYLYAKKSTYFFYLEIPPGFFQLGLFVIFRWFIKYMFTWISWFLSLFLYFSGWESKI